MFKNFGTQAQKCTFHIEVKNCVLPDMLEHFEGTEMLCVSFERKNYPSTYTADRAVLLNRDDEIVADFNQTLTATATMYKDSKTGLYKEKLGKLNLLQRKQGYFGVQATQDAFKTVGVANLPLHVYALVGKTSENVKLQLSWCLSERAYLIVNITPIFDGKEGDVSDDRSVASNDNSVNPPPSLSSSNSVSKYNSNNTATLGGGKYPPAIPEEEEEDDHIARHVNSAKKQPYSSSSSTSNYGNNNTSSSSSNRQSLNLTPAEDKKFSASQLYRDMKARLIELENAVLASAEIVDFEKTKCKEIVTENTTLIHSLQSEIIGLQSDLKEVNERYNQVSATNSSYQLQVTTKDHEIFNLQQGINSLEKSLRDKNDECETLLQELIACKVTVSELSTEVDEVKKELRTMKQAREKAMEMKTKREAAMRNGGVVPAPVAAQQQAAPARPRPTNPMAGSGGAAPAQQRAPQREQAQQPPQYQGGGGNMGGNNGGGGGFNNFNSNNNGAGFNNNNGNNFNNNNGGMGGFNSNNNSGGNNGNNGGGMFNGANNIINGASSMFNNGGTAMFRGFNSGGGSSGASSNTNNNSSNFNNNTGNNGGGGWNNNNNGNNFGGNASNSGGGNNNTNGMMNTAQFFTNPNNNNMNNGNSSNNNGGGGVGFDNRRGSNFGNAGSRN